MRTATTGNATRATAILSGAILALTGIFAPTAQAQRPTSPSWSWQALGAGIGGANINVADRLDGSVELILGAGSQGFGGNRTWFVLSYESTTQSYDQRFVAPEYASSVLRLVVGDVRSEPGNEIVVVTADGTVEIWSQETRTRLTSFTVPGNSSSSIRRDLDLGDVDNDGTTELVFVSGDVFGRNPTFGVYDGNGTLEFSLATGGNDVVVGQMDDDPALEIALSTGEVVDGATRSVQWTWPDTFGGLLNAADVDGDGREELYGVRSGAIWSYDVERQLPWSSNPGYRGGVAALEVGDVDGDGDYEVIVGAAQWGDEVAYDALTWQQEWVLDNTEHGTTDVTFGDIDGDGSNEVIWGAGWTSSGADFLFVGDPATGTLEWQSSDMFGPFFGPFSADIDGDAKPELIIASRGGNLPNRQRGSQMLVFEDRSSTPVLREQFTLTTGFSGMTDFRLVQIDADPELEIAISTGSNAQVFDFDRTQTDPLVMIHEVSGSGAFGSMQFADVDSDGQTEIVASHGQRVYAYDLATGTREWESLIVAQSVPSIRLADTDGDGHLEIYALGNDGDLYVFDGRSKRLEAIEFGDYSSINPFPTTAAASDILILGDDRGGLSPLLNFGSGPVIIGRASFTNAPVQQMTFIPGWFVFFYTSGDRFSIFDGATTAWQSDVFDSEFGARIEILDQSGLVVTAGRHGIYGF